MDQTQKKIDMEARKELFAYEMTQVALMLKGEFATVSGKDLGYAQHHVSAERRNVPKELALHTEFPQVQLPDGNMLDPTLAERLWTVGKLFRDRTNPEIRLEPIVTEMPVCKVPRVKHQGIPGGEYVPQVVTLPELPDWKRSGMEPCGISGAKAVFRLIAVPETKRIPAIVMPAAEVLPCAAELPVVPCFELTAPTTEVRAEPVKLPAVSKTAIGVLKTPELHSVPLGLPDTRIPEFARNLAGTAWISEKPEPLRVPKARRVPVARVEQTAIAFPAIPLPKVAAAPTQPVTAEISPGICRVSTPRIPCHRIAMPMADRLPGGTAQIRVPSVPDFAKCWRRSG